MAILAIQGMFMLLTSFSSVKASLFPLVILALVIDSAFIAIWYIAGSLLGNSTVKAGARDEFYQLIGTALLIGIVIATMYFVASAFISIYNATSLMSSTAIYQMCSNILSNTIQSNGYTTNGLQLNYYYLKGSQVFPGLCTMVQNVNSGSTLTTRLDYPLSATTIIIANLTNQAVEDYQASFEFDALIGFLSKLSPQINVCASAGSYFGPCFIPLLGTLVPPDILLHVQFSPYAGYSFIYKILTPFGTLLTTAIEFYAAQLSTNVIALYMWPYLIFFGLILRSVFLTRKLGGLLIAAAIGIIIFFPAIYSIEYLTLANINPSYNEVYGYSTATSLPYSVNSKGQITSTYTLNFFVMPNLQKVIGAYNCLPADNSIMIAEGEDIGVLLIPFYSIAAGLISVIESGSVVPNFILPSSCPPYDVMPVTYAIFQSYGIMGITAYFLPIINLMITITAIIGVSSLLGGDTELAGISRLV